MIRALAMVAVVHVCMFACYTLPNTWLSLHAPPWPKDLQRRSYLTDYICGEGTNRACPGPGIPIVTARTPNLPPPVPFVKGG